LALAVCSPLYTGSDGQLLSSAAHAQSKPRTSQGQPAQKSPADQLRSQVETLINRLRGRDMPEGIVKSNGRIEATQVDVSAKYPGRLATLTVDEGDELTWSFPHLCALQASAP
jgi:HlyD family secretion protein